MPAEVKVVKGQGEPLLEREEPLHYIRRPEVARSIEPSG